jgi:hypothetical protein
MGVWLGIAALTVSMMSSPNALACNGNGNCGQRHGAPGLIA